MATGSLIGYPVGIGAELITTFVAWLFAVHGVLFWQSEGRWYLVPAKALVTCRPVWIEGDLVAGCESPLARSVRSRPASAKVSDIYFLHLLPALYWHFCADWFEYSKAESAKCFSELVRKGGGSLTRLWAKFLLEKNKLGIWGVPLPPPLSGPDPEKCFPNVFLDTKRLQMTKQGWKCTKQGWGTNKSWNGQNKAINDICWQVFWSKKVADRDVTPPFTDQVSAQKKSCGLWSYQICYVVFQDLPKQMRIKEISYNFSARFQLWFLLQFHNYQENCMDERPVCKQKFLWGC